MNAGALIPIVITEVDSSPRQIVGGAPRPVALAGLTPDVVEELSTILGGVEFASLAEAQAGVVTNKAVAPSSLPLFKPNGSAIQVSLSGNARGANAIDLSWGSGTSVAAGADAVLIGGRGSRSEGSGSICIGSNYSTVSGSGSVMIGSSYATLSGTQSAILGGYIGTIATSPWSVIAGGYNHNISTSQSLNTIVGGSQVTVTSTLGFHTAVGGRIVDITNNAYRITVVGGDNTDASGTAARNTLFGRNSMTTGDDNVLFCEAASQETFAQDGAFYVYGYRPFLSSPNSAPTDSEIKNGVTSFWVDESGNNLTFRVRYSDGTLKTGTVALT